VFFPQGNWEFNSATERMVQLYPTPFWELISMTLAVLVLALCALAWLLATIRARSLSRPAADVARAGVTVAAPESSREHAGAAPMGRDGP
jgi:hypothetical protein